MIWNMRFELEIRKEVFGFINDCPHLTENSENSEPSEPSENSEKSENSE